MDNVHNKLREIAYSFVMVFNPTDEDFIVKWAQAGIHEWAGGGQTGEQPQDWLIPNVNKDTGYGNGKKEVPFFIANKYFKEMHAKIINQLADKRMADERKKWKRDPGEFAQWWENSWKTFIKVEELKVHHKKTLILGITRKYSDNVSEQVKKESETKVIGEDIIKDFEGLGQYTASEKATIEENKESLISQVAQ